MIINETVYGLIIGFAIGIGMNCVLILSRFDTIEKKIDELKKEVRKDA